MKNQPQDSTDDDGESQFIFFPEEFISSFPYTWVRENEDNT